MRKFPAANSHCTPNHLIDLNPGVRSEWKLAARRDYREVSAGNTKGTRIGAFIICYDESRKLKLILILFQGNPDQLTPRANAGFREQLLQSSLNGAFGYTDTGRDLFVGEPFEDI